MKTASYYLLLGSIVSSALAACADDESDECAHDVVVKSKDSSVSAAEACRGISLVPGQVGASYGILPQRCAQLCRDLSMNACSLPGDYLRAFAESNGSANDAQDGGVTRDFECPTSVDSELTLTCTRHETRGTEHEGCAVAGRRPQGLVPARRHGQEVADYLARCAHLEAASVLAFEELAKDLTRLQAPAQLVAACLRAARQEVAHARTVRELARARGAEPAAVQLRERALPSLLELALHNAVEGVVRESYGALQAIVSGRAARAADIRLAMTDIASDEAEHAALALQIAAWLHTRLSAAELLQVSRARDAAIAELRQELDHEPSAALRAELGMPSRTQALRLVDALAAHLADAPAPAIALA
jgi:rubrerythrin